jgi:hypothetical protein
MGQTGSATFSEQRRKKANPPSVSAFTSFPKKVEGQPSHFDRNTSGRRLRNVISTFFAIILTL